AKMKSTSGHQMIAIGMGSDYNHSICKALADGSGGTLHNITDAQKITLPDVMQKGAVNEVAARSVIVDFGTHNVTVLNYKGPPVTINAVETTVKVWGKVPVPAGFK